MSETVGDIDITVAAADPAAVMAAVVDHAEAAEIVLTGDTKTSFLTTKGLQVDVRVVAPDQFGAAILYFTGSKAHNIALRQRAIDRGWLLNEYGLMEKPRDADTDAAGEIDGVGAEPTMIASRNEADIYTALDLEFIPAPMREATGEIDAAGGDGLPELIRIDHIKGDLHYHTDLSGDGRSPLAAVPAPTLPEEAQRFPIR